MRWSASKEKSWVVRVSPDQVSSDQRTIHRVWGYLLRVILMKGGTGPVGQIKVKIRFDYVSKAPSGKFFGNKNIEQLADNIRQQKVAKMRNVPIQGVRIEDIDMSQDIYTLVDDVTGKSAAYAPVVITIGADKIDEVIKFIIMDEFRTIEILEPTESLLTKGDLERLLFVVSQELSECRDQLRRQLDNGR